MEVITNWRRAMVARGLRPETIKLRTYHVTLAMETLGRDARAWSRAAVEQYLSNPGWSPATRRSHHASLKNFLAWHPDIAGAGIMEEIPAPRVPRGLPRPASDSTIMDALRHAGPREQLMIELMAYGGLRRGEVAKVRGDDVNGHWLRVEGKGGHTRLVPLPPHVAKRVQAAGPGYVFPGQINGHLSPRRVGELVGELLPHGVTAHTLRHRFATTVYSSSHDIVAVQRLLGHAKLETTMVYTDIATDTLGTAAAGAWALKAV